jgi:hypothetical protein
LVVGAVRVVTAAPWAAYHFLFVMAYCTELGDLRRQDKLMTADPLVAGPAFLHGYRAVHEFLVEHPLVALPGNTLPRLIRKRRTNEKQKYCKERNTDEDNSHPNSFKANPPFQAN